MKQERRELPLDEVVAGMVLADEVCDARGAVLLPRGASLTDAVLTGLGRRGIETLPVLVAPTLTDDELAARRAQLARRLDHLFRFTGNDRPARELRRLIGLYVEEHR